MSSTVDEPLAELPDCATYDFKLHTIQVCDPTLKFNSFCIYSLSLK